MKLSKQLAELAKARQTAALAHREWLATIDPRVQGAERLFCIRHSETLWNLSVAGATYADALEAWLTGTATGRAASRPLRARLEREAKLARVAL